MFKKLKKKVTPRLKSTLLTPVNLTRRAGKTDAVREMLVKVTSAGAIEQPAKVRGVPGKKMEPHHIEAVGKALRRGVKKAITIKGLAKRLRCSPGAAERRFNAFMKKHDGFDQKVKSVPVRDGARGPFSTGFYL